MRRGDFTASLLALAGMRRLGLEDEASVVIDPEVMVPSACQGIVGITVRAGETALQELLGAIEDVDARCMATGERALLGSLDGSCRTPIGGHARLLPSGRVNLTGLVARTDGSFMLKRSPRMSAHRRGPGCGRARRQPAGRLAAGRVRLISGQGPP